MLIGPHAELTKPWGVEALVLLLSTHLLLTSHRFGNPYLLPHGSGGGPGAIVHEATPHKLLIPGGEDGGAFAGRCGTWP